MGGQGVRGSRRALHRDRQLLRWSCHNRHGRCAPFLRAADAADLLGPAPPRWLVPHAAAGRERAGGRAGERARGVRGRTVTTPAGLRRQRASRRRAGALCRASAGGPGGGQVLAADKEPRPRLRQGSASHAFLSAERSTASGNYMCPTLCKVSIGQTLFSWGVFCDGRSSSKESARHSTSSARRRQSPRLPPPRPPRPCFSLPFFRDAVRRGGHCSSFPLPLPRRRPPPLTRLLFLRLYCCVKA